MEHYSDFKFCVLIYEPELAENFNPPPIPFTMKISVELTLTPLQDDYEAPVINFIKKLRASGLTVLENPLSTQVYGDYETVMNLLTTEIGEALMEINTGLLYMKIVKSDRSGYEPDF